MTDASLFKTEIVECKFAYHFEHISNYKNQDSKKASNHIFEISGKAEF